jgi:hypothetical protein
MFSFSIEKSLLSLPFFLSLALNFFGIVKVWKDAKMERRAKMERNFWNESTLEESHGKIVTFSLQHFFLACIN